MRRDDHSPHLSTSSCRCPLAVRRQRRDARSFAVRRPSAWSRKCPHICASHPPTRIVARRSMRLRLFSSRTSVPCGDRRQEDRQLRHHARRCRERPAAGSHLCRTLLDRPGAEFFLERRVSFPPSPAPWDARPDFRIGSTVHVIDFKFGTGVRVRALYLDGDEDVINAQLLFYGAAARHSLPEFFAGVDNIILTILQPVSIDPDAEWCRRSRLSPLSLMSLSRSTAPPVKKHFHPRRAWSGAPIAASARRGRSARRILARFSIWRNSWCRRPPRRPRRKRTNSCSRRPQPRRRGQGNRHGAARPGETRPGEWRVPGYALSAGRAERSWHDEDAPRSRR